MLFPAIACICAVVFGGGNFKPLQVSAKPFDSYENNGSRIPKVAFQSHFACVAF
jgi:hypothetical protein